MKTETSAGGIVLCRTQRTWYVLILKDMNGTWTFPKGLIEKNEQPEIAAGREIAEEVGLTGLRCMNTLTPIQYFYKRSGNVKKTVQYFLFIATRRIRSKPQKEEGISEAKWARFDDAMNLIGYRRTNVPLLEEAWTLLRRRTSRV